MMAVSPEVWLQSAARMILAADKELLAKAWNVTENILGVRSHVLATEPEDLRARLAFAQSLVDVAVERNDLSLLDYSLIGTAQVLDRDVSSGRFAAVGMLVLLCPPLARAETFQVLCDVLDSVPARSSSEGGDPSGGVAVSVES